MSCQGHHLRAQVRAVGYYSAYRHLVAAQPHLVAWCGDYIDELPSIAGDIRTVSDEAVNLDGCLDISI